MRFLGLGFEALKLDFLDALERSVIIECIKLAGIV
jgi:hypothetical protein